MGTLSPVLTQQKQIQPTRKRVLVLGSVPIAPTTRREPIAAYAWNDLPPQLNVADYDVVILNLVAFGEQQAENTIRPERLPTWQQLARFLFSPGSEIICIGLPGTESTNSLYQSTSWWLPITPEIVMESGETVRDVKPEFAYYFEQVRRWFFYAKPSFQPHFLGLANYLRIIHPQANKLQVGMGTIAQTRTQQSIAFKLIFRASFAEPRALPAGSSKNAGLQPLVNSGIAIWLPPPTEISTDAAIQLILRERYGLGIQQAPPNWIATYKLPQQTAIEAQIAQHQQTMQAIEVELKRAQQQLAAATSSHRLLYESHGDALAGVVADALHTLGAKVSFANPDILRVTDPVDRELIIVVKAQPGAAQLNDLRQLDQWVRDLMLRQDWRGKGILIANTHYALPPADRPAPFPPNCLRAAQHFGYGLLTTYTLFQILSAHQNHKLDTAAFWHKLAADDRNLEINI